MGFFELKKKRSIRHNIFQLVQKQPCEDPDAYPQGKFGDAFLAAISEYNQFGVAATSIRFRIDSAAALQLFGFKVT